MSCCKPETIPLTVVRTSPILDDIPPEVLRAALAETPDARLELPAEAVFLHSAQIDPGLYLILDGTVELFGKDAEAKEKILDFARAGDTLAAETLFTSRPLQYSVRSLTPISALHLPHRLITEWVSTYPAFALRLMSLVAERIDYLFKDMLTLRTKKATARVVCYLVCHFDKAPRTPDGTHSLRIDIPRHKLASRLGITDSHLSRAFRELQENGMIVAQDQGYFIPDVPALSLYVCPAGCAF
jgi:CRP/FNR family transcriptional regulator, dissimilatory nitrate respiration regulator